MLSLKGLRQRYGAREVLALDRFEAAAGEHWLVLGASGSGKTTLLNLAAGLLSPSEGEIEVGGQALAKLQGAALDRWRGRSVGIVPQKLHLVQSLSILENLLLAPFLAGLTPDTARAHLAILHSPLAEVPAGDPSSTKAFCAKRILQVANRPRKTRPNPPRLSASRLARNHL